MISQQKKDIRLQIRELKKNYSLEEKKRKSIAIFKQIEILETFQKSKRIMAYWSMDDEVFTHDFILKWFPEKQFILPSVKGDELELRVFSGMQNMTEGTAFGIKEPNELFKDSIETIDLILVPGIAFDKQNNRLGRGKAYYDKFLKNTHAYKIGICFDFQLLESVPTDEFDIKMDRIIFD